MGKVEDFFKNKKSDYSGIYDTSNKKKTKTIKPVSNQKQVKYRKAAAVKNRRGKKIAVLLAVGVLIVGSLGAAGYFFVQNKKLLTNRAEMSQDEAKVIANNIQPFMVLPAGTPILTTVDGESQASDQSLFPEAEIGDKILFYIQDRKAILYRPALEKVLEVVHFTEELQSGEAAQNAVSGNSSRSDLAPAQPDVAATGQPANDASGEVKEKARVAVYNGTVKKGLAAKIADSITSMAGIEVTEKSNTNKSNFTDTLVIDLTGGHDAIIQELTASLGAKTSGMPPGEKKPDADILIIGGNK